LVVAAAAVGDMVATTDKKIICSGTTYGSTERMLWYLQRMNTAIREIIALHEPRYTTPIPSLPLWWWLCADACC
jgi:hypothetical protein